ncbi:dnaJ-like protein 60 isoform X2 [Schistocerca nitens]|uniref:dnaJ-like protein 60 isoform X2 n=1 Tax=Schistocerca nitens TaxID=7011 RepID=UPI0021185FCE|nr:dnaJ-like protein 60 isoform X2 [Schistocerca nitens]
MQNSSFASFACHLCNAALRNFHSSRYLQKTHYEVLKIARNSSNKDIKEAFIKLSKKFHPDINKNNPDTHNEFVKLNEAYSILSRPDKRREYDLSLQVAHPSPHPTGGPSVYENDIRQDPWKDPSFFRNRDRSRDDENRSKPYYGIGKLGRLPNSWLVAFLFAVTAVGVALQAVAIRHSMTLRRSALDEASARHSVLHTKMQEQAHDAGNHNNLRMMHSRLGGTSAGFALLMKDGNRELAEKQPVEKPPSPIKVVDDLPAVDAKAASIG